MRKRGSARTLGAWGRGVSVFTTFCVLGSLAIIYPPFGGMVTPTAQAGVDIVAARTEFAEEAVAIVVDDFQMSMAATLGRGVAPWVPARTEDLRERALRPSGDLLATIGSDMHADWALDAGDMVGVFADRGISIETAWRRAGHDQTGRLR